VQPVTWGTLAVVSVCALGGVMYYNYEKTKRLYGAVPLIW